LYHLIFVSGDAQRYFPTISAKNFATSIDLVHRKFCAKIFCTKRAAHARERSESIKNERISEK